MRTRSTGIALITTLGVMVVLMTVVGLLVTLAVSDLQQARSSIQQMQARAVAEAGEVHARYVMSSPAQSDMKVALRTLMRVNVDPANEWVISQSNWNNARNTIQTILNSNYSTLASSAVNDLGSATIEYQLENFRGGTRSRSAQSYVVDYTVTSTGTANGAVRRVQDMGVFEIQIGKPSLSQYLFLVEDAGGLNGFFPTGARFNGPAHANSNWGFWGEPEFLDTVSTSADGAYYYNSGDCSGSYRLYVRGTSRPPCTVPLFAKGFLLSQPRVELPTSALSQQRAALGLDPEDTNAIPARVICSQLRVRPNCNANSSVPNGVYLVNDGANVAGGIYIQGNASRVRLDGSSRDGTQVYSITQGSSTWTITVDYNNDTTTFTRPDGTQSVFTGVPNGPAPLVTGGATGQIYATGRIDDLSGPGRSGPVPANPDDHPVPSQIEPALAKETELHVTAQGRIDLRSDLVYECDPVALANPDYLAQFPRCAMSGGQVLPTVLGVMSLGSEVRITTSTPNDLYLWGSYLAGTNGQGLTVQNYASRGPQGALRLFGGVIQYEDQLRGTIYGNGTLASGYMETFDYDLRFANGVVAPPNFPTVRTFDVQRVTPVKLSFFEY